MLWLHLVAQGVPTSTTPVDQATSSLISYIVSWGTLGIFALLAGWLLLRGWRLASPAELAAIRKAAREESRADLIAERDRILTEKQQAEDQRDEALQVARDQLAPLLQSFVATTTALLPILQEIIRESPARRRRGGAGP